MSQNQQQHQRIAHRISQALQITSQQVAATAQLLEEGATVPFISRYRKEVTGSLDETQVTAIRDQLAELAALEKRRQTMLDSLATRELLSPELEQALGKAEDLTTLEDIFLPYKQKRKTRASMAKEKGLEPLAQAIFTGQDRTILPADFVDPEKEVHTEEEALAGARDIIAEWISEDTDLRTDLRRLFANKAEIRSSVLKKKQEEGAKYRDYFDWQERAHKAPSHRLLAMFRGAAEKVLRLTIRPDEDAALALVKRRFSSQGRLREQLLIAVEDSYKRLLGPSLENELRADLKQRADQEAITVFADNLQELLLAPALGQKRVMALDPGFRTGAKLVCLSEQGQLLDFTTVYPTHGTKQQDEAGRTITTLCQKHRIEAIAIGNGTAGRETEQFVRGLGLDKGILVTLVNESGASIYSASEVARREFPDHDITVRGRSP